MAPPVPPKRRRRRATTTDPCYRNEGDDDTASPLPPPYLRPCPHHATPTAVMTRQRHALPTLPCTQLAPSLTPTDDDDPHLALALPPTCQWKMASDDCHELSVVRERMTVIRRCYLPYSFPFPRVWVTMGMGIAAGHEIMTRTVPIGTHTRNPPYPCSSLIAQQSCKSGARFANAELGLWHDRCGPRSFFV